jgi:hypothetical protein
MKLMRIDKPIGTNPFEILIYVLGWSSKLLFIQLIRGLMDNEVEMDGGAGDLHTLNIWRTLLK